MKPMRWQMAISLYLQPEFRIPVSSQRLQWTILHQALDHGRAAEEAHRAANLVGLPERNQKRRRRRRPEQRLKMVEPLVIDVSRPFDSTIVIFSLQVSRCVPDCASPRSDSLLRWSPVSHHSAMVYCRDAVVPLFPLLCTLFWYCGISGELWAIGAGS